MILKYIIRRHELAVMYLTNRPNCHFRPLTSNAEKSKEPFMLIVCHRPRNWIPHGNIRGTWASHGWYVTNRETMKYLYGFSDIRLIYFDNKFQTSLKTSCKNTLNTLFTPFDVHSFLTQQNAYKTITIECFIQLIVVILMLTFVFPSLNTKGYHIYQLNYGQFFFS